MLLLGMLKHLFSFKLLEPAVKRIGIMTKPIEQGYSGSGKSFEQIVSSMQELNEKYEIILLHYDNPDKEIYKHFECIKLPSNPLVASYKIRKLKLDIIHYSPLTLKSPIYFVNAIKVATIHGGASFLLRNSSRSYTIFMRTMR